MLEQQLLPLYSLLHYWKDIPEYIPNIVPLHYCLDEIQILYMCPGN